VSNELANVRFGSKADIQLPSVVKRDSDAKGSSPCLQLAEEA